MFRKNINKKAAAAVLSASLLGGAGVASVISPTQAYAADNASSSTTQITPRGPGQHLKDVLGSLVGKGTISQEQSDAVIKALEESRPTDGMGPRDGRGFRHKYRANAAPTDTDPTETESTEGENATPAPASS